MILPASLPLYDGDLLNELVDYLRQRDVMVEKMPTSIGNSFINIVTTKRHLKNVKVRNDKRQTFEELYEPKGSRTVLKPSGGGDPVA